MSEKTTKPVGTEMQQGTEGQVGKTTPWRMSPFEDLERMFEGFAPRGWLRPFHWERPFFGELAAMEARMPKVDIIDREGEVLVKAEVPGVAKEDIEVSVEQNTVTIRGKTRHEEKEEKGDYYRSEIRRGSFSRTVALPRDVDGSQAKATFKDGMLELTLPKVAKSDRVAVKVE